MSNTKDIKVKAEFEYADGDITFTVVGLVNKEEYDNCEFSDVLGYIEDGDMMTDAEGFNMHTIIEGRDELDAYYKIDNDGTGNVCVTVLEEDILILPMKQETFIEFYYSDQSSSTLREMAYEIINTITNTGEYKVTVQELFDNCGYFPIGLLDITEELGDQLREAIQDDELESSSGVILEKKYEIVLKPVEL